MGKAYVAQKQYANAIRCYGRVLAAAPDSAEVLNSLGSVHQLRGESKRAAECFRRALALKPDYAQAHCNLGVGLRKLGRLSAAYRQEIRRLSGKAQYFVSTLDTNIFSLAEITTALPVSYACASLSTTRF